IPRVPFQQMIADPAAAWLSERQVTLKLGTKVNSLLLKDSRIRAVDTAEGEIAARNFIVAVPPLELMRILPTEFRKDGFFKPATAFSYSSIAALHLDYDRVVLTDAVAGTPQRLTQWILGRGLPKREGWSRLSAVVSAAPDKSEMSSIDMTAHLINDIQTVLPLAARDRIINQRLIRNSRATVLLSPGSSENRLPAVTPVENLFLAGDWTQSDLPATIESAARSGWRAVILSCIQTYTNVPSNVPFDAILPAVKRDV
ncbi:MAG: FAD-dependent oxidoreductase, partial [Calditrichota bacterium]